MVTIAKSSLFVCLKSSDLAIISINIFGAKNVDSDCRGVIKTKTQCILETCLFICILHESGLVGVFYVVCVADQCLSLYSGLTQGQGHTV